MNTAGTCGLAFSQGGAIGSAGGGSSGNAGGFARSSAESSGGGVARIEADGVAGNNQALGRVSSMANADSRKNKRTNRVSDAKSRVSTFNKTKSRVDAAGNADGDQFMTRSSRSVAVHDGETKVEITDRPESIRIKVTTLADNGEKIELYAAKNIEELKRTSPEGYKLYEKYLLDDPMLGDSESDEDASPARDVEKKTNGEKAAREQFQELKEQMRRSQEKQAKAFEETVREQRRQIEKAKQEFEQRVREQQEKQERLLREFSEQNP